MKARIKKGLPLTLGAICLGIVALTLFPRGVEQAEISGLVVPIWFFLGGTILIWAAFRRTAELEITEQVISIRGCNFERSNIVSARIFRVWFSGGRGRFIELQFKKMPRLSLGWKIAKMFENSGFPGKCERGIPLGKEPRIVTPLNLTDMSDDDLNRELTNANKTSLLIPDLPPVPAVMTATTSTRGRSPGPGQA